ncbi:MAG: GntR family transcriptional regulator [Hyphomicrobiaceae bacterium]|nr:GntR family transcriptional regulator [Hyphomicrobiaceae bacterium]
MSSRIASKPLYVQLREALAARIASGEWRCGVALPNEIELADSYGLSPGTVRKALDLMEAGRLIVRQQGRGTFVREWTAEDIAQCYVRLRTADGLSVHGASEDGNVVCGEATPLECERLRLAPGSEVRRTRRKRVYKGKAYAVELSVVPGALFTLPPAQRHLDLSILELVRRCGVMILSGEERLRPATATAELAARLGCAEGQALFAYDRVLLTLDEVPAVWETGHWHLPDGYYLCRLGDPDQPA